MTRNVQGERSSAPLPSWDRPFLEGPANVVDAADDRHGTPEIFEPTVDGALIGRQAARFALHFNEMDPFAEVSEQIAKNEEAIANLLLTLQNTPPKT
jgi:hypothetical protein